MKFKLEFTFDISDSSLLIDANDGRDEEYTSLEDVPEDTLMDVVYHYLDGQAHFSHKQLEGLNSNQIQELLFQEKGINWNDYPTKFKRGSCCIKKYHQTMNQTLRSYWFIDNEIPIFKGEDREYIEKLIA